MLGVDRLVTRELKPRAHDGDAERGQRDPEQLQSVGDDPRWPGPDDGHDRERGRKGQGTADEPPRQPVSLRFVLAANVGR